MKNTLKKISLLFLLLVSFIACDKDYNDIGTNLITHSNFITDSVSFPALTYNKVVPPVRSSNLTSSLLGVYNDPTYGLTTAHIVSQVIPTTFNPDFGEDPVIDSVYITIPYFSTDTGEDDEDGNSIYKLDSLYGSSPIKLSIYENTYFLRDYDPASNLEEQQLYYSNSNQSINFNNFQGALIYEDASFVPDASEIVIKEFDEASEEYEVTERLAPALRITYSRLENDDVPYLSFWSDLLFSPAQNGNTEVLSNANNFVDYFRGLYFKTEALAADGHMTLLDFTGKGANITVYYSYIDYNEDGEEDDEIINGEYQMNLSGNKVNIIENNFDITLANGDDQNGDETIYLKGTEGSMGVIKLFDGTMTEEDGTQVDAFDYFREHFGTPDAPKRLINEANLIVYVNRDMIVEGEPDRLYLYDLNNNTNLIDYFVDPTGNTATPIYSKIYFSEILERDETADGNNYKKGIKYKFRITEHLNNILLRDSTNLNLGLVATTNINSVNMLKLEGATESSDVETIPLGAFLSPRGTVVYGSHDNVPEDKRLELEIFYSELPEPEN